MQAPSRRGCVLILWVGGGGGEVSCVVLHSLCGLASPIFKLSVYGMLTMTSARGTTRHPSGLPHNRQPREMHESPDTLPVSPASSRLPPCQRTSATKRRYGEIKQVGQEPSCQSRAAEACTRGDKKQRRRVGRWWRDSVRRFTCTQTKNRNMSIVREQARRHDTINNALMFLEIHIHLTLSLGEPVVSSTWRDHACAIYLHVKAPPNNAPPNNAPPNNLPANSGFVDVRRGINRSE
jgi:hypothetical protein